MRKLPIKISAGLGLSLLDRAVKEFFARRCSKDDLEKIREYFLKDGSLRCFYCASDNPTRWDHLHAVARGGDTVPGNLVPACQRCDDSKQDKNVEEWVAGKSKHRPSTDALQQIVDAIRAYRTYFSHEPQEFELKLSESERQKYLRFRKEIDALRVHLQSEGLLR